MSLIEINSPLLPIGIGGKWSVQNFLKLFYGVAIGLMAMAILLSLITNPKSLNPENNQAISMILGAIVGSFTTLVGVLFAVEHGKSTGNSDDNSGKGFREGDDDISERIATIESLIAQIAEKQTLEFGRGSTSDVTPEP